MLSDDGEDAGRHSTVVSDSHMTRLCSTVVIAVCLGLSFTQSCRAIGAGSQVSAAEPWGEQPADLTGVRAPDPKAIREAMRQQQEANRAQDDRTAQVDSVTLDTLRYFDWADSAVVTRPRGQVNQSCWAFAAVGVIESAVLKRADMVQRRLINDAGDQGQKVVGRDSSLGLSEPDVVACSGSGDATRGGWWPLRFAVDSGIAQQHAHSYDTHGTRMNCGRYDVPRLKADYWGYVPGADGVPTERELKRALLAYGPIAVTMFATKRLESAYMRIPGPAATVLTREQRQAAALLNHRVFTQFGDTASSYSRSAEYYERRGVNHALIITGWNDTLTAWQDTVVAAWHVKNSWGTRWGNGGMGWIRYRENSIGHGAVWVAVSSVPLWLAR
jgi:hypothetical protein